MMEENELKQEIIKKKDAAPEKKGSLLGKALKLSGLIKGVGLAESKGEDKAEKLEPKPRSGIVKKEVPACPAGRPGLPAGRPGENAEAEALLNETKAGPKEESADVAIDTEEMMKAGVNLGHRTSRSHPKMQPYISGIKNGIHIIDLEKTAEMLSRALAFIRELTLENKVILLVGTKIQIKDLTKDTAEKCGFPYVNERWLGGTLTNLPSILKRIEYFKNLEKEMGTKETEKYTKKERIKMEKELEKLRRKFEGIKNFSRLPDAVLVLDMKNDKLAIKEAGAKGVKTIAVCDTSSDPTPIDYPIPANDDAISSVKYILEKVKETIIKAKSA